MAWLVRGLVAASEEAASEKNTIVTANNFMFLYYGLLVVEFRILFESLRHWRKNE
jgi:hypothetical protein